MAYEHCFLKKYLLFYRKWLMKLNLLPTFAPRKGMKWAELVHANSAEVPDQSYW